MSKEKELELMNKFCEKHNITPRNLTDTWTAFMGIIDKQHQESYISIKYKEQRLMCVDAVIEDNGVNPILEVIHNAPSPTDKKKEKEETTSGSPTDRA